jgi:hypothetical protein
MIPHHIYYQLASLGLLWLCIILHYLWPSRGAWSHLNHEQTPYPPSSSANAANNALASCRSAVSKPSVNQP